MISCDRLTSKIRCDCTASHCDVLTSRQQYGMESQIFGFFWCSWQVVNSRLTDGHFLHSWGIKHHGRVTTQRCAAACLRSISLFCGELLVFIYNVYMREAALSWTKQRQEHHGGRRLYKDKTRWKDKGWKKAQSDSTNESPPRFKVCWAPTEAVWLISPVKPGRAFWGAFSILQPQIDDATW